jgi:hypothetical protein
VAAYLLEGSQLAEVADFAPELARRRVAIPSPEPALVNADGTRLAVPAPVFDALVHVATAARVTGAGDCRKRP